MLLCKVYDEERSYIDSYYSCWGNKLTEKRNHKQQNTATLWKPSQGIYPEYIYVRKQCIGFPQHRLVVLVCSGNV